MKGVVFNIQRYSIHDGPGIRTVVFLKGCPLTCVWCSNPESQAYKPELEFLPNLCQHCGLCIEACPEDAINTDPFVKMGTKINRDLCTLCGDCADGCPSGALKIVGQERSVDEVLDEVMKDGSYYRRSGGGVTLSGGEPMGQPDFARELMEAFYDHNVHTAIETTGIVEWPLYEKILPFTDLFLYDIKQMNSLIHRQLTRVPNERILENVHRLADEGANIILRIPMIQGLNTDFKNLEAVADLAAEIKVLEVHLMPFHQMGKDKYRYLDREYSLGGMKGLQLAPNGQPLLKDAIELMTQRGLKVFIGG